MIDQSISIPYVYFQPHTLAFTISIFEIIDELFKILACNVGEVKTQKMVVFEWLISIFLKL